MFSIARFSEQFMILFRQNKNRHGLILLIFIGFQVFSLADYFTSSTQHDMGDFYKTAVFMTVILSVMACQDVFNKLRSTPSGIQYLMTPATILEKYSAAWLYSSLFAFTVAQLIYFGVQLVGIDLGNLITGMGSGFGFPDWKHVWNVFLTVMYLHSVFFFGSLFFRKNPIVKTLVSYIGIVLIFTMAFAWYAKHYLINAQLVQNHGFSINLNGSMDSSINGMPLQHVLEVIGLKIEWILGIVALLLWSGSYVLLNKKQI
ncbi:MAG TPA: hypothetical protein VFP20_04570 [Bacteroidales bacterium]|nr:hypothetical protein [Bacteroidales bacterium]